LEFEFQFEFTDNNQYSNTTNRRRRRQNHHAQNLPSTSPPQGTRDGNNSNSNKDRCWNKQSYEQASQERRVDDAVLTRKKNDDNDRKRQTVTVFSTKTNTQVMNNPSRITIMTTMIV
jgi:hypothetical protein